MKPPDDTALCWKQAPGRPESLEPLRDFVISQARKANMPNSLEIKLDLAAEEVLLNVFHYAFESGQAGNVAVGCGVVPDKGFLMRVVDPGKPFNPLEQPRPDIATDIAKRKVGGLGIFLTRQMSSSMTYARRDEHNILDVFFKD